MNKLFTSICLFVLIILGTVSETLAQSSAEYWSRFERQEREGLNLEAGALLDTLEMTALQSHDTLQLFRVHFERAILLNTYDQHHQKAAIFFMDSVMQPSVAPYRNLYERMLVQFLNRYFQSNFYAFVRRSVPSDTTLANIDQWSAEILRNAIAQHQQASQADAEILKQYPLKDFLFLFSEKLPAYKYESATLYDFIFGSQEDTNSIYSKAVCYYSMALKSDKANDWLLEAHRLFTQLLDSPKALERHNAKAYLEAIEQQQLQVENDLRSDFLNTHKLLLSIQYRNLDTLYVTCFKKTRNQFRRPRNSHSARAAKYKATHPEFCFDTMNWLTSKYLDSLRTERFVLPSTNDYYEQTTDLFLDSLSNGNYLIVFHNSPMMDTNSLLHAIEISICDKNIVKEGTFGSKKRYRVVDATTGVPVSNVKVLARSYGFRYARRSDADGLITLPQNTIKLDLPDSPKSIIRSQRDWSPRRPYGLYSKMEKMWERRIHLMEKMQERRIHRRSDNTLLITDRTIYRPGQKVYFKVVDFNRKGHQVAADREVEIYFRSCRNFKKIDSVILVTNTFGSADSCFVLPENLEPGQYFIVQQQARHPQRRSTFEVEQYKRPSFELKMDTIKEAYALGDTVNLWGRAIYYSGLPVPGATARVSIAEVNAEWNATTDPAGYFHVAVPTALLTADKYKYDWSRVVASIVVSEPNGETQTTQKVFSIAGESLTLKIKGESEHVNTALSQQFSAAISLSNQDGATMSDTLQVSVCRLEVPVQQYFAFTHEKPSLPLYSPADYQRCFPAYSFDESECDPRKFKVMGTVWERKIADTTVSVNVQDWETGLYKMIVQTTDPHGKTVKDSTLFSVIGKGPFRQTTNIYTALLDNIDSSFKENGVLHYCIGSSTIQNANVFYNITYNGKTVKQGKLVMTDTLIADSVFIKIPEKSIRGNAKIVAYTFHHNHLYKMQDVKEGYYDDALLKSFENELQPPLQIQVEHLNDNITPGTQETWSFTLSGKDSTHHPEAEMLAMLYDASLDPLTAKHWYTDRDFNDFDNNASFIAKEIGKRKYIPLYKERIHDFFAPVLMKANKSNKKSVKPLPQLSIWDAQLPSASSFSNSVYSSYEQNIGFGQSIIKGEVRNLKGEPVAYTQISLKTVDNKVIDVAWSNVKGCYSLYGVPEGLYSLTADGKVNCKGSQTKMDVYISYKSVTFIDFTIDCDSKDEEVIIKYEPPVFEMDMTTSTPSNRVFAEPVSVRGNRSDGRPVVVDGMVVTSGRSRTDVLDNLEGVSSVDGEISSARELTAEAPLAAQSATAVQRRQQLLGSLQPRCDFAETAFFLPQLRTDAQGRVSFQFKAPDQLTRWHFTAVAHTKDCHITTFTRDVCTQRALMVMPNVPRFVREGDTLLFQSTILATECRPLQGDARLEMWDSLSKQQLAIAHADQPFRCDSAGRALAAWTVSVPHRVRNLQYKLAAVGEMSGYTFSDAETRKIPVLPQTIELNEANPFHIDQGDSSTITTHFTANGIRTLHISTHPTWAIYQTLPYLINSRHDCSDELMNKYFANTLAQRYLQQNPLLLRKAELDTQMRNLFDTVRIRKELRQLSRKIHLRQTARGGWGWFDGTYIDKYITTRITTLIGQLNVLGEGATLESNGKNALRYLCGREIEDYTQFEKDTTPNKQFSFDISRIRFLYALSYFADIQEEWLPKAQMDAYLDLAEQQYVKNGLCEKAMLAIACHRLGRPQTAAQWAEALRQQAHKDAYGLSWTELRQGQRGWRDVAVSTEALLMELFYEALPDITDVQRGLKEQTLAGITQWLLAQRTTNHWGSNATSLAVCYALALQEKNSNAPVNDQVQDIIVRFGDTQIHHPDTLLCGQYGLPENGDVPVVIENRSTDAVYGSVWMQCQQNLDSVKNFGSDELSIRRTLHRRNYDDGRERWDELSADDTLHVGDVVTVRFVIENARNMDYVNISDMRACALEPMSQVSQWNGNGELRWYESPRDNTTEFYMTHLDRGTHVLEYKLKVTQAGVFRSGTATIESMQASEFTAHSDSPRVRVEKSESGEN